MSSLALSLIIIVLAAIGGVLAFNHFQAADRRRVRKGVRARQRAAASATTAARPRTEPTVPTATGTPIPASQDSGLEGFHGIAAGTDSPLDDLRETEQKVARFAMPEDPLAAPASESAGSVVPTQGGDPGVAHEAAGELGSSRDAPTASLASPSGRPEYLGAPARGLQRARRNIEPARIVADVECVATLVFDRRVGGDRVNALSRDFRRAGGKPVLIEGSRDAAPEDGGPVSTGSVETAVEDQPGADNKEQGQAEPPPWEPIDSEQSYRALRVAVLLANRHGPLNAMEFSEFSARLHTLAQTLGGRLDHPDMQQTLARGRELDARCAELDSQIGINVEAPEALSTADLAALAADVNIAERGNNRFARISADGEIRFSVSLGDAPNKLCFLLDVPRVTASGNPLAEMVSCARDCARRIQGRLVDDAGRALTQEVIGQIEHQLAERHRAFESAGFPTGSAVALRLFN